MFVNKDAMDGIERVALSAGISVAIVGLIGFGLNYSPWGIKLEPVLYSISAFILVTLAVALIRRGRTRGANGFTTEITLGLPSWGSSAFGKSLSIFLVVSICTSLGVLGYTAAAPKGVERFTDFYILGVNGKAQDYPKLFIMDNGKITQVAYGDGSILLPGDSGNVTIGIVNQEQESMAYFVRTTINDQPVSINLAGSSVGFLGPIELRQGEKWENPIGIVPVSTGDNQTVALQLFKGADSTPQNVLRLWITVRLAN